MSTALDRLHIHPILTSQNLVSLYLTNEKCFRIKECSSQALRIHTSFLKKKNISKLILHNIFISPCYFFLVMNFCCVHLMCTLHTYISAIVNTTSQKEGRKIKANFFRFLLLYNIMFFCFTAIHK